MKVFAFRTVANQSTTWLEYKPPNFSGRHSIEFAEHRAYRLMRGQLDKAQGDPKGILYEIRDRDAVLELGPEGCVHCFKDALAQLCGEGTTAGPVIATFTNAESLAAALKELDSRECSVDSGRVHKKSSKRGSRKSAAIRPSPAPETSPEASGATIIRGLAELHVAQLEGEARDFQAELEDWLGRIRAVSTTLDFRWKRAISAHVNVFMKHMGWQFERRVVQRNGRTRRFLGLFTAAPGSNPAMGFFQLVNSSGPAGGPFEARIVSASQRRKADTRVPVDPT